MMSNFFLELIFIATIMIIVIIYTLYSLDYKVKSYVGLLIFYFVQIMMITMFIGAILYLLSPSNYSLAEAIIINNATMLLFLVVLFSQGRKLANIHNFSKSSLIIASFLTVLNEILMGATFSLASFGPKLFSSFYLSVLTTLNSYWFFYPMMIEMLSLYLIDYIKGNIKKELFPLIGITTFPPTLFNFSQWVYSSLIIDIILSILGIINSKGLWRFLYIITLFACFTTLTLPFFFNGIIIIDMIYFYYHILRYGRKIS